MQTENLEGQESIFGQDSACGKMSSVLSQVGGTLKRVKKSLGRIFKKSSKRSSKLKNHTFMLLDLRPGAGNMLGAYWEYDPPWLGSFGTPNTSECPKDAVECSLWQILQATAPSRYSLSQTACLGILRRAACRGKSLPPLLETALRMQAGLDPPAPMSGEAKAYHINQRNEGIDLNGVSGALMATTNMQMQTFVAEGMRKFESAEKEEECLCLNDQGGERMDVSVDVTATLRAGMSGHPPLVMGIQQGSAGTEETPDPALTEEAETGGNNQQILFENHGIDARYTGPHEVAPTMSARYGTGGNNVPLVSDMPESYCIAGNIIDREVQNGGNGLGCQPDISYTLTSADRHAVFSRQRSDEFLQNRVTATQSARQHKDATDLVCEPYQNTVGTIGYTDHKGINNQYVSEDKCIVENRRLIRRLTPLECERLQGFPDHWTDIPGASDSARYKALGNSVAIPCVDFVLRGIAYFLRKMKEEKEP